MITAIAVLLTIQTVFSIWRDLDGRQYLKGMKELRDDYEGALSIARANFANAREETQEWKRIAKEGGG